MDIGIIGTYIATSMSSMSWIRCMHSNEIICGKWKVMCWGIYSYYRYHQKYLGIYWNNMNFQAFAIKNRLVYNLLISSASFMCVPKPPEIRLNKTHINNFEYDLLVNVLKTSNHINNRCWKVIYSCKVVVEHDVKEMEAIRFGNFNTIDINVYWICI